MSICYWIQFDCNIIASTEIRFFILNMSFQMKHNSQHSSGQSFPLLEWEVVEAVPVPNVAQKGDVVIIIAVVMDPIVLNAVMNWFASRLDGLLVKGSVWKRNSWKGVGKGSDVSMLCYVIPCKNSNF